MFKKTAVKLTIFYSSLFFILFWSFSFGLYAYLVYSFKSGYVTKVRQRIQHHITQNGEATLSSFFIEQDNTILDKSREVTLENFRRGLLLINGILFIIIPTLSWFLVRRMLYPVRETFQKQRRFVSDASHELRTPLAIMGNEIEVTLQQEREPSYYIRTLTTIKEEVLRLSGLVKNLLMLARQRESARDMEMQEVEVADLISKVLASFASRFEDKDIKYKVEFPEENCVIKGNVTMLEQLFANLIDNALKFSPSGSTVNVTIEKEKKHVKVSVKDEGPGIAKEHQEKIFDRFYRVDSSRTQTKGYGLGLPIVKSIVELHRGSITVHSTPGKGSVFSVSFSLFR